MRPSKKSGLMALTLILSLAVAVPAVPALAQTSVSVTKFSLPSGATPIALTHDASGDVVYGSAANGTVFIVNAATSTVEHVDPPSSGGPFGWTSLTYRAGAVLAMNNGSGSFTGGIWEFDESSISLVSGDVYSATWHELYVAECPTGINTSCVPAPVGSSLTQILFSAYSTSQTPYQFLYAASGSNFWKIGNESTVAPTNGWQLPGAPCGDAFNQTGTVHGTPACYFAFPYPISSSWGFTPSGRGNFEGIANDSKGDVLLTDRADGRLLVYNATTDSEYSLTGLASPTGVAVIGAFAYVAENVLGGSVANVSLSGRSIVSNIATESTSQPFGVTDLGGSLVWDSNTTDAHVCLAGATALTTVCTTTGESNYYMAPSGALLFVGYKGSSGVLQISGLLSSRSQGTQSSCQTGGVESGVLGVPVPEVTSTSTSGFSGYAWELKTVEPPSLTLLNFSASQGAAMSTSSKVQQVSTSAAEGWLGEYGTLYSSSSQVPVGQSASEVYYWNFTASAYLPSGPASVTLWTSGSPFVVVDCQLTPQQFTLETVARVDA